MIDTRIATEQDAPALARLADEIWSEHYAPLLGQAQVDYMLARFQSQEAIARAIAEGTRYHMALCDGTPVGYLALKPEAAYLFLSKIYVEKGHRGRGIARRFVDLAIQWARDLALPSIRLTVNKGNDGSIAAYKKMGFVIIDKAVTDIGDGYVMDDYIMELRV
jgi:RimJ/RimL family protein N-acetyltransferase